MFKKNKKTVVELKNGKEVAYLLYLSTKWVEIESASKEWSVRFWKSTNEYGLINLLVKNGEIEQVTEIARAFYLSRLLIHAEPIFSKKGSPVVGENGVQIAEMKVLKDFYSSLERMTRRTASQSGNTKNGSIILAEEKVLHEKTAESIQELENIKKDGQK